MLCQKVIKKVKCISEINGIVFLCIFILFLKGKERIKLKGEIIYAMSIKYLLVLLSVFGITKLEQSRSLVNEKFYICLVFKSIYLSIF